MIAAGLAGNYFGVPIFFGIEFLFGSIFAMLVMQFFGFRAGAFAAIAISSVTFFSHHQPFDIIIMTLEVIAVGWLYHRKGLGLVVADALYWFCFGIPLTYLFQQVIQHFQVSGAPITMLEQAINGITNALLARLIFMSKNLRSREIFFPLREVVFNLLALFVLIPSLAIMAHENREEFSEVDRSVRKSLVQSSQSMKDSLESWLGQKNIRIAHLAWRARYELSELQHDLDFMRSLDPDLNAVGVIDKSAISIAFSPLIDECGQSAIGKDFSDRPYLSELKRTLLPQLSEVVISKIGKPEPVAVIVAPVVVNGVYDGYAAAAVKLERIHKILFLEGTSSGLWCTVLDRNNTIIATNRDDLQVMGEFPGGASSLPQVDGGVSQRQSPALESRSTLERWQNSVYVSERNIGSPGEWRLIVEQPLGPVLEEFYALYAKQLKLVFLVLLIALVFAELFSRKVLASVVSLQEITSRLPGRLDSVHDIIWPTSFIREVEAIIVNFRGMASLLVQKFSEISLLNQTLEQRVDERSKAFQESEEKYHIIFENKMYAIYIFDLETLRLLDVNGAFTVLYGYSREEVANGMKIHDINAWYEDTDFVVQEAMRKGSIFIPLRYHLKKDGSIFPVELAGGPYVWQGRRVMFVIANDITERNKATEALQERTNQLEDLTKNLAVKVEKEVLRRRKNEQILIQQSKLAAMGEMLGAIAHQWRQPLNSLGLCIQNIKDSYRFGELSEEYLDRTVQESMVQLNHMSRTIDDFRNFFQPDKDKARFDVMMTVGEVLALFSAQLISHDISFVLTCLTHQRTFYKVQDIVACSAKITLGYKNEFEHVVLNLVNNARDAIFERREKWMMPVSEQGLISFEFQSTDGAIIIRVSDNGCGIPDQMLDRIFEPYFTTKEPDKGTGIGLYLSKIIIEDHMHGKLSVENSKQGASFVLVLPAVKT